jgi:hypothetical protein
MFFEKFIDLMTEEEWLGLLYIHTFHYIEFQSSIDESLQIYLEMLWVNHYVAEGIDIESCSPIKSLATLDINTKNTQTILDTISGNNIAWHDPLLEVGKQFILQHMPDYHNKIDRAIDKVKERDMLVAFYSGTMDTDVGQQERRQIYIEDDLSDYYSTWNPDSGCN